MRNYKNLCMNCMKDMNDENICPHCGYERNGKHNPAYIQAGSILDGKYIIGEKISKNSESVKYIGYDIYENCAVYIKEFMPEKCCSRSEDGTNIEINQSQKQNFDQYMKKFLELARSIARLRELHSIIPVYDIVETNNTAYYISCFIRGITLKEFIKNNGGHINWDTAKPLFIPLLLDLITMHKSKILHLGINPNSLIVSEDGKLKLYDFSINDIRQVNHLITEELFSGYSAPEQYLPNEKLSNQTDIYGFSACLLYSLSGKSIANGQKRKSDERLLISKNSLRNIPDHIIKAIANGLKVYVDERTTSFDNLRYELCPVHNSDNFEDTLKLEKIKLKKSNQKNHNKIYWIITPFTVTIIALFVLVSLWSHNSSQKDTPLASSIDENKDVSSQSNINEITVPDFTGNTIENAKKISSTNENYEIVSSGTEKFNDKIKEGHILSQNPTAGSTIKKGGMVVVVISKGPETRILPEIKGLSLADASKQITSVGLVPNKTEEYSNTISAGSVIGYKNYNTGDSLKHGEQITIIISKGPKS